MASSHAAKALSDALKYSRSAGAAHPPLRVPLNRAPARHCLYEIGDVEKAVAEMDTRSGESRDSLSKTYRAMRLSGPWRPLAAVPALFPHQLLRSSFPNFAPVIDFIDCQLALCALSESRVAHWPPILLLGEPGIGKTALAKRLAATLSTSYEEISLPGATAAFTISGLSSGWSGGKCGRIFQTLNAGPGNPVILLDEIEKAGGDSRYDVANGLLTLLEHHSATRFIDEYVEVPIDASRILWIATANDAESMPAPLISRFHVFHISSPDAGQARQIAWSVYRSLLSSFEWGEAISSELPEAVVDQLAAHRPREQWQLLVHALGNAARSGRTTLTVEDIPNVARRASRIGF